MMNENPFRKPSSSTWQSIQALVQTMLDDSVECLANESVEKPSVRAEDIELFYRTIALPEQFHAPSADSPLLETWCSADRIEDWFTVLKSALKSLSATQSHATTGSDAILRPLLQLTEDMSSRLEPAPAMRGYSPARMHFPKRSRRIHAADLPHFTPMFCTALAHPAQPVEVNGLLPEQDHRCRFRSPEDSAFRHEVHLTSDASGALKIPFSETLSRLPEVSNSELVWFLEEVKSDRVHEENWVSGIVWKQPVVSKTIVTDLASSIQNAEDPVTQERIHTLMAINLMVAEQRYQEAYETTRQALLFAPALDDDDFAPFSEALWHFVGVILQQMTAKLRSAEVTFRHIRPEWNAADSLDRIIDETRLISSR